jgi:hypothetical protein
MASDFQRRKIAGGFDAMDEDGRGFLVEDDFEALAARWTTLRGLAPGSSPSTRLRAIMLGWWASLSSASENGVRVGLEDVMTVVDVLPSMADAVTATEYRQLIEAWNGRETDTDEIFALLDLDGDGYLSHEEFRTLWSQFWAGDDPRSPGTWVFGRFDQSVERRVQAAG